MDCFEYEKYRQHSGKSCDCDYRSYDKWNIQCELCKECCHPECSAIPKSDLEYFVNNDIHWWCPYCWATRKTNDLCGCIISIRFV